MAQAHAREGLDGQTFATHGSLKMQSAHVVADGVECAKAPRRLRAAGRQNTVCHVGRPTIRPRGAHRVQGLQGETEHNTTTHDMVTNSEAKACKIAELQMTRKKLAVK